LADPASSSNPRPWRSILRPALRRNSRDLVIGATLALLAVASWAPRLQGPLDLRWDAGVYYVLGTALAQGKGYRLLNEPGEIEAIQYPPLLPTLVAVHQLVLRSTDPVTVGSWLRVTFLVISVLNVVAAYALLRAHLGIRYALLGALVLIPSARGGDELGPEALFMLASTLFVLCATSSWRGSGWMAGLLAVVAYLLRTAGIALLAAWVGESLLRGKVRSAMLRLTVALIPVLAWHGYIALVERSTAYTHPAYPYQRAAYQQHNVSYARNLALKDPFTPSRGPVALGDLVQRVRSNAARVPATLGEVVSAPRSAWDAVLRRVAQVRPLVGLGVESGTTAVLVVLGGLIITGVVYQAVRGQLLLPIYVLAYGFVVSNTAWAINLPRYWSPLAPVLVLAGLHVVAAVDRRRRRRGVSLSFLGLVAVAVVIIAVNAVSLIDTYRRSYERVEYQRRDGRSIVYRLFFYRDRFRAFDAGLDWLMQHAQPTDIVATSMPHWVYLRTGLRAVMPPAEGDPPRTLALLDAVPVTYVLVGGSSAIRWAHELAFPAVRAMPEAWMPVYAAPGETLVIYRRLDR
jgi:hypothetical protein